SPTGSGPGSPTIGGGGPPTLQLGYPVVVADTASRTFRDGWGTPNQGKPWVLVGPPDRFTVTGGQLSMTTDAGTNRLLFAYPPGVYTDMEFLTKVSVGQLPTTAPEDTMGVAARMGQPDGNQE